MTLLEPAERPETTSTARALWALDGARLFIAATEMMPGSAGVLEIPLPSFLIEHENGLVLIDTGLAPQAGDDVDAIYGDMKPFAIPKMTPEQAVDAQLRAIGKRPEDVTHVVLSHSHFDHTGGLPLFGHATHIINRREWEYILGQPEDGGAIRRGDFAAIDPDRLVLVDGDHDLFGDGAITMLALPGHTPGNSGVLVRLPQRKLLLTLDTVHARAAFDDEIALEHDTDREQARASIQRLKQIGAETGAEVWIGHDPDDRERFGAPCRIE